MESIELELDAQFFSKDVISHTVYRYSGDYFVRVECTATTHRVSLSPRTPDITTSHLAERLQADACADRLREQPVFVSYASGCRHTEPVRLPPLDSALMLDMNARHLAAGPVGLLPATKTMTKPTLKRWRSLSRHD
nr:hypothetical protein [uncultured Pseudoxanthomonas sp.]